MSLSLSSNSARTGSETSELDCDVTFDFVGSVGVGIKRASSIKTRGSLELTGRSSVDYVEQDVGELFMLR